MLNPDKFQFAEKSVDFAGFRVSDSTIEPLPKYLDAIKDFPSPTSTTDIRSWFGLVNQVSNYAQLRDSMAPFKPFLSPRCKFSWSPELESTFQASKEAIIEAIRQGVEIFDIQRRTCLRPDWSKRGIGYFLLQQHCSCPSGVPDCCPEGWRITLAGSGFLNSAEQHKPLIKIFGDRALDEITNSRLFRLKQRTLPWRFEIRHLPGTSNHAADATSRHPSQSSTENTVSLGSPSFPDIAELALMNTIRNDTQELGVISWSLLATETAADVSLGPLLRSVEQGKPIASDDPTLTSLRPICESLYAEEGVLLYQDRVIVPPSLRRRVLQNLHAAHQGTSSMEQRARAIVYWPGISKDIRETREGCVDCNRNAPSQAATPPLSHLHHHYPHLKPSSQTSSTTEAAITRPLRPLTLGERVFLQNQQGPNPTKWDRSGVVVESAGHDQYRVKVDGSGRITLRNRRFLRAYTPATPSIRSQQPTASQLPTSSANQCPNPPPSVPTLQTPQSTQPTAATPNNPNVVQAPAPLSPLTPARPTQVNSPNLDAQSRDLQLPTSPDEDSSMPPTPPPLPPEPVPRPRRISRPPKRYEPETGKWVT